MKKATSKTKTTATKKTATVKKAAKPATKTNKR